MTDPDGEIERTANFARYRIGTRIGHYESFFQRANSPTEPRAFWIRYTAFCPAGAPEIAIGEVWAVWFDGVGGSHVAVRSDVSIADCEFAPDDLFVRISDAQLSPGRLHGCARSGGDRISWLLEFEGDAPPLLLFPARLYSGGFPRAKALVPTPFAKFRGHLDINGKRTEILDWIGSHNHNWGSRHTDEYAWGQVAGFDDAPDAFLEIGTGRLHYGPVSTPWMTPIVLRIGNREHRLNSIARMLRNRGKFAPYSWAFSGRDASVEIEGVIEAPRSAFVALGYMNPPGGIKHCLNTKLASCRVAVTDRQTGERRELATRNRAAFEILTDRTDHGLPVLEP